MLKDAAEYFILVSNGSLAFLFMKGIITKISLLENRNINWSGTNYQTEQAEN